MGPYVFFDVYQGKEVKTSNKSFKNDAEHDFILRLLDYMSIKFYGRCSDRERRKKWDGNVGIVTPYSGQVQEFKRHLSKHRNELLRSVFVDTVESFQGQEKDIIIFSCVRSQRAAADDIKKANLGFLVDTRRLNVALTRAKLCCVIVGNSQTLRSHKIWKQLINDAHNRGRIHLVDDQNHKRYLNRPSSEFVSTLDKQRERAAASAAKPIIAGTNEQKSQRMDIEKDSTKQLHRWMLMKIHAQTDRIRRHHVEENDRTAIRDRALLTKVMGVVIRIHITKMKNGIQTEIIIEANLVIS